MSTEYLKPSINYIEIDQYRYTISPEIRNYLIPSFKSDYPKNKSVAIISEPHDSVEGHFNLFKGLEKFFNANQNLIPQTIFLSEGSPANKNISVEDLIKEEPNPSDSVIRQVLQSHLITGYIAYEWKHQNGIPIIGTEDEGLYNLSRRFASICRDKPGAIFKRSKDRDGNEHIIYLDTAWSFVIAARNKMIAQTLIENLNYYKNPILFTAIDHVTDFSSDDIKSWYPIIKKLMINAQFLGPMGGLQFEPGVMGQPWEGHFRAVNNDTETYDINHYLKELKIGYTFIETVGETSQNDIDGYNRIFRGQI